MPKGLRIPTPVKEAIAELDPDAADMVFWEISDDEELETYLFENLLDALDGSDIDLESLPPGYGPLLDVLEFELHCQSDGWTAVKNKGTEELRRIIDSYCFIGLNDESRALAAVLEAYRGIVEEDKAFHEVLGQAYRSVQNSTPDIEHRLPIIFAYVRNNAESFGTRET